MIRHRRTRRKSGNRIILYIIALIALGVMYLYERIFGEEQAATDTIELTTQDTSSQPSHTVASQPEQTTSGKPERTGLTSPAKEENEPQSLPTNVARNDLYREGWAELPAEKRNKEFYYAHHIIKGEARRNYSVCFSRKHRCPVWVAYPLHPSYKGDTKRSDSFDYDPALPIDIQPLLRRSFGEYTRGHLLGSAERSSSMEANQQTFYATNIAPQTQEGFNASNGAWNNLERFAARQMCADTLYVVTGCLFDDFTDSDGTNIKATTTTNKNDGKKIAVPTAYYKVLLRTRKGNTGRSVYHCKAEELKCAAFIVGHRSAAGRKPTAASMMSVEELERIAGVEFFAGVANAPKDVANARDWGL